MTLKAVVRDISEVSEELRGLYVKGQDGRHYLDLDPRSIEELPAVKGLASNKDDLLREKKELQAKLDDLEDVRSENEKLQARLEKAGTKGGKTAEEIAALKEEHEKEIAALKAKSAEEVEAAKKEAEAEQEAARSYFLDSEVTRALQETGGSPSLLSHVMRSRFDAKRTEDGRFQLVALDGRGEPMGPKDSQGSAYTAKDVALELQKLDEYAPAFRPSGSSGSGAAPSGQSANGRTTFDRNDPKAWGKYAEQVAKGEAVAQ